MMFSYSGSYGGVILQQQPHCNVVYDITSLLCDIGFSGLRRWQMPRLDESFMQEVLGQSMECIVALFACVRSRVVIFG